MKIMLDKYLKDAIKEEMAKKVEVYNYGWMAPSNMLCSNNTLFRNKVQVCEKNYTYIARVFNTDVVIGRWEFDYGKNGRLKKPSKIEWLVKEWEV